MMLIKLLLNLSAYIFYALIILTAFLTITSYMTMSGGLRSLLIRSGSMEPTIMTGDVILIKVMETYGEKDVVTFKEQGERIVTHRILKETEKEGSVEFITKGDANRSIDNDIVKPENIIGKVMFIVPKLGLLATCVRTPLGLMIIIIIPAILIVMDRVMKIKSAKSSYKNSYT